eukprot:TRINITY_DN3009_c0_g1_i14.p3 TRINITY_DN3009_c0_g1~~TRINITY_DN3009_c0_g1_i14.p3  ORF type:complete len:140 (-),score=33.93 TRINITY_DN3009_c0_g1_i14:365-784(-)
MHCVSNSRQSVSAWMADFVEYDLDDVHADDVCVLELVKLVEYDLDDIDVVAVLLDVVGEVVLAETAEVDDDKLACVATADCSAASDVRGGQEHVVGQETDSTSQIANNAATIHPLPPSISKDLGGNAHPTCCSETWPSI